MIIIIIVVVVVVDLLLLLLIIIIIIISSSSSSLLLLLFFFFSLLLSLLYHYHQHHRCCGCAIIIIIITIIIIKNKEGNAQTNYLINTQAKQIDLSREDPYVPLKPSILSGWLCQEYQPFLMLSLDVADLCTAVKLVGSPSVYDNDTVCAVSDESSCDSTVQSWKLTGAHGCHNDSPLFGSS